jgi:hypothetical protein
VRRPHLTASALAAFLACGACDGEPRVHTAATVAGDWAMTEREGKPLPHTMRYPLLDRNCTSVLIRNVLTLRADGTYAQVSEARAWCDGDARPDTSSVVSGDGRWELRGPRGDTINLVDDETASWSGRRASSRGTRCAWSAASSRLREPSATATSASHRPLAERLSHPRVPGWRATCAAADPPGRPSSSPTDPATMHAPTPDELVRELLPLVRAFCAGEPYGVALGGSHAKRQAPETQRVEQFSQRLCEPA